MFADATDHDCILFLDPAVYTAAASAVRRIDPTLPASLQNGMLGNDLAEIEYPDLVRQLLDLDNAVGAIRNAV